MDRSDRAAETGFRTATGTAIPAPLLEPGAGNGYNPGLRDKRP